MEGKRGTPPAAGLFRDRERLSVRASPAAGRVISGLSRGQRLILLQGLFMAVLGVGLAMVAPYGTGAFAVPVRLVYWVGIMTGAWGMWQGLYQTSRHLTGGTISPLVLTALLIPLFAIVGSLLATSLNVAVGLLDGSSFLEAWPYAALHWMIFSLAVVLPLMAIGSALASTYFAPAGADAPDLLVGRLPPQLRDAPIEALQAEDHYVRVHTQRGDHLVHMRLEDAMALMAARPGVQTHRSWWVALDAVPEEPRGNMLTTRSGVDVPVSRRRRKQVLDGIRSSG